MKIVREHINEKFIEKSDPIRDMDITPLVTDLDKVVRLYYSTTPGYFLTNSQQLVAYHPESADPLKDYANELASDKRTSQEMQHWEIISF